jgi:pimeloyl-ACP methyl ester carboxylesterase
VFSGDSEPTPLADIVRRIDVPVLLIASNRRFERHIDSVFAARIGPSASLWYVPDAGHTRALERHPELYRERVLGFLARALG